MAWPSWILFLDSAAVQKKPKNIFFRDSKTFFETFFTFFDKFWKTFFFFETKNGRNNNLIFFLDFRWKKHEAAENFRFLARLQIFPQSWDSLRKGPGTLIRVISKDKHATAARLSRPLAQTTPTSTTTTTTTTFNNAATLLQLFNCRCNLVSRWAVFSQTATRSPAATWPTVLFAAVFCAKFRKSSVLVSTVLSEVNDVDSDSDEDDDVDDVTSTWWHRVGRGDQPSHTHGEEKRWRQKYSSGKPHGSRKC